MAWDGFVYASGVWAKQVSAVADEPTAFAQAVAYLAANAIPQGQFVVLPTGTTPSTSAPGMALHDQEGLQGN